MHSAPSVSYPVGRSSFGAAFLLLAWLGGASATALWWVQVQPTLSRLALAVLVLVATGLLALRGWLQGTRATLSWDGESWYWAAQGAGTVSASLDLQARLLLCWEGDGGRHWLWLERAACAERWEDLRRAVYSRARTPTPGAQPPAAQT